MHLSTSKFRSLILNNFFFTEPKLQILSKIQPSRLTNTHWMNAVGSRWHGAKSTMMLNPVKRGHFPIQRSAVNPGSNRQFAIVNWRSYAPRARTVLKDIWKFFRINDLWSNDVSLKKETTHEYQEKTSEWRLYGLSGWYVVAEREAYELSWIVSIHVTETSLRSINSDMKFDPLPTKFCSILLQVVQSVYC